MAVVNSVMKKMKPANIYCEIGEAFLRRSERRLKQLWIFTCKAAVILGLFETKNNKERKFI